MSFRKTYVLFALAVGLISNLSAQEVTMGTADLLPVLCHNWEMEFASMQGTQMKQKPGAANTEFEFNADGTYSLLGNDGSRSKGAWAFNKEMNYVELRLDGKEVSRIKSVVENKLVMVLAADKNAPPQMAGIEIHFKRKE